jgi:hypothetical protein
MSEARETRVIRFLVRGAVAFFAIALLIYPADWVVWKAQTLVGGGMGSVKVGRFTVAELKSNKEEYYPEGTDTIACSRSLFPQGGNSACWWLRRHPQIIDRY